MARPTDYKDNYPDVLLELMKEGKKGASLYAHFEISRKTFYNWCKAYPEFLEAYERGWELCERWWEEFGLRAMLAGDEAGYKYWKDFMAKNFGYGRNENAQSGPQINIGSLNVYQGQSKDELIKIIQEHLKELPIIEADFVQDLPENLLIEQHNKDINNESEQ